MPCLSYLLLIFIVLRKRAKEKQTIQDMAFLVATPTVSGVPIYDRLWKKQIYILCFLSLFYLTKREPGSARKREDLKKAFLKQRYTREIHLSYKEKTISYNSVKNFLRCWIQIFKLNKKQGKLKFSIKKAKGKYRDDIFNHFPPIIITCTLENFTCSSLLRRKQVVLGGLLRTQSQRETTA